MGLGSEDDLVFLKRRETGKTIGVGSHRRNGGEGEQVPGDHNFLTEKRAARSGQLLAPFSAFFTFIIKSSIQP